MGHWLVVRILYLVFLFRDIIHGIQLVNFLMQFLFIYLVHVFLRPKLLNTVIVFPSNILQLYCLESCFVYCVTESQSHCNLFSCNRNIESYLCIIDA